ncbi:glycosyltransferase [Halapricum sp. CBA1109]|uniref:glycosyltransferase family 2 protein n=1 Tax=Halapricum sp. CBA1109 TaxID=2668068 RepID=UPI0012F967D1|nr:glycosyltransferase [Halapricum sp. CBA1109]MUV88813.1 glycosyltransferase [Halapricum sp. CBA1109]
MTVDPTTAAEPGAITLSVVVITENEADHVRECLASVIAACQSVEEFEVILVDSASTDRTVEYASEYPVTVLRIPEEHTVSCGAGRFVGDQVATGEYVLHIDGDMTLTEEWLPAALAYLRDTDAVAAEGCLDESTQEEVVDVEKIGGVMLYDAAVLRSVGGFDPFLPGYEDIDVGFKLRTAGHRLVRLPAVSAIHHHEDAATEPLRRWRQGYYTAPGQTVRKWLRSPPILGRLLARQQYKLGLFGWLCLGVGSLRSRPLRLAWLALSIAAFAVVARKRGVAGAADFFVVKGFGLVGLAAGLTERTPPADSFPLAAVEVVATGRVLTGERTPSRSPSS